MSKIILTSLIGAILAASCGKDDNQEIVEEQPDVSEENLVCPIPRFLITTGARYRTIKSTTKEQISLFSVNWCENEDETVIFLKVVETENCEGVTFARFKLLSSFIAAQTENAVVGSICTYKVKGDDGTLFDGDFKLEIISDS